MIVNADEMSISGGSKTEFWPVLMKVKESENGSLLVDALYDGDGKPADLQAYMENFLGEMDELLSAASATKHAKNVHRKVNAHRMAQK